MKRLKQGEIMSLEDFGKRLDEVQELHNKEVAEGKSDFNVFEALGVEYKENYHSAFLAYLLDSEESHYQKIFIEKFLEKLKAEKSIKQKLPKLKSEDIEFVETEYAIRENRRIDILMGFKNDFYILIENKVYAKDQDKQIRDYIEDLLKGNKCEERNKASGLLTIYLTPFENNPSERSFGLKSNTRWEIVGSEIIDKNPKSKIKPLYFKMDYQWIQDWIKECLEELKNISQEIIEKKPKRELGINKVIFTLEQYLDVLDWIIPDREIREDNPVLKLICDEKYQQYAFEIYHNKKYKQRKIVADVWEDFEEHIVRDFFIQLEDYCDENPVNLTKKERWFVFQTHKKNYNTTKQYRLRFFPKKYYDTNYWVGFNIFYNKPNYGCPSIDLRVHFADDCDSEDINIDNDYKQIKSVVLKKLKSIVYRTGIKKYKRSKLTYWKENFLELGDGENLVSWILTTKSKLSYNTIEEKNQAVIEKFIEKMKTFTMDNDIRTTYRDMVRIANEEHEGFEQ